MEIIVPELGESVVEATVARWLKQEGDPVSAGEPVVELETDKVDLEVGAKADGVLAKIHQPEGADVQIGDLLAELEPAAGGGQAPQDEAPEGAAPPEADQAAASAPAQEPQAADATSGPPAERREKATPVAQRMAQEKEVNLQAVPGSGPGGRVTKRDLERHLQAASGEKESPQEPPPAARPSPAQPAAQPASASGRREERQRLSRRRRTIAARLVEAQQTAAMLTTFNDVDLSAVIDLRSRRKAAFEKQHGVKLGFMSFFVKASVGALKQFPHLNAELDGDELVIKHYYDIGVAIGAEEGLVVPVVRDADRLSFAEIETTIRDFVERTQSGDLTLDDLRGGTFTITNGGVFGSLLSTPILNPPQVAILGMHRIEERPIAVDGQVAVHPMMYLALSYDHRVVDGSAAVQFLGRIKALIEDPETLLLEG